MVLEMNIQRYIIRLMVDSKYNEGFLKFKEGVEEAVNIKFEETSSLDKVKDQVDKYDALAHIEVN